MGSGEEIPEAGDSDPVPSATRFGRRRFVIDPEACTLVETVDKRVRQAVSMGSDGVEKAYAISGAVIGLGRKALGPEAKPPEAG